MKYFISFLLLFSVKQPFAQSRERLKESTFNPSSFENFYIELTKKKKEATVTVDFKTASFIDMRADTSKLGFILAGENPEYRKVVFHKSTALYLNEKVGDFYAGNNASAAEIVFVLNQVWVSERLVKTNSLVKNFLTGPIEYLSYCYLNTDCYTNTGGSYNYIGTIDTVLSLRKWIVNVADNLLKDVLIKAITQANLFYNKENKSEDTYTYTSLIEKYKRNVDYPVLKTATPAKGIYLTYTDFLNNQPAVEDFTVIKEKKTEYLKSDKLVDSLLHKAWGYFDGSNLNIHINDNYYRAVRTQNTYELAGPRDVSKIYSSAITVYAATVSTFFQGLASGGLTIMMMGSNNKIMKEIVPYQLSIKDGLLY